MGWATSLKAAMELPKHLLFATIQSRIRYHREDVAYTVCLPHLAVEVYSKAITRFQKTSGRTAG